MGAEVILPSRSPWAGKLGTGVSRALEAGSAERVAFRTVEEGESARTRPDLCLVSVRRPEDCPVGEATWTFGSGLFASAQGTRAQRT